MSGSGPREPGPDASSFAVLGYGPFGRAFAELLLQGEPGTEGELSAVTSGRGGPLTWGVERARDTAAAATAKGCAPCGCCRCLTFLP